MKVGGWGTGALEGFASFMAEAAMKNSAKAKLGDAVKIGTVSKKCEVEDRVLRVHGPRASLQVGATGEQQQAERPSAPATCALRRLQPASRRAASAMSAVVPA